MREYTKGNRIVDASAEISITGNITPQAWYKTIVKETGKPHLAAIVILSDIVYWYRPTELRNESTGQIIAIRKKFKADLLQRSYQQIAEQFGLSKKEATKDNGQPVQNIQPRVTKPEQPDQEVLKNPNQKPDGESVQGAPVPENHDEVKQPETDTVPGAAPEGESQEGKIYAPGFGWIDDIGEGEGIEDSNIYENGNKIGIMD